MSERIIGGYGLPVQYEGELWRLICESETDPNTVLVNGTSFSEWQALTATGDIDE